MKSRDRLDKILQAGSERIQAEVSSLLGKPFKIGEPAFRQISKEDLFVDLSGKSVLAHVSLDGDVQGKGCLLVSVADAIRIGGLLIMLPDSELESVVTAQDYSEELKDSFGEVANIICGAVTFIFEEQYPKTIRLIRTEQEVLIPTKVEADSAQPIPNGEYYVMTVPMETERHALGDLTVVLPIDAFGLESVTDLAASADATAGQEGSVKHQASEKAMADTHTSEPSSPSAATEPEPADTASPQAETAEAAQEQRPPRDTGKQKKLIDTLLKASLAKISEDTSGLLGGDLQVVLLANGVHSKESFLEQIGGKQVMARMDIRGDHPGEALLFVESKTAIYLGGSLIMLPESELDETVRNEDFNDDTRDAYGEVANIIAGAYTVIFEEQYRGKLGFVKTSMEIVAPTKIDPDSDDVFPRQVYYLSTGQITYNGRELGQLQMLVPASVFELEELFETVPATVADSLKAETVGQPHQQGKSMAPDEPSRLHRQIPEETDILMYSDDEEEGNRIAEALRQLGHAPTIFHFKEPVNNVLTSQVQLVLLVMGEVSEQGFGVAIKLNSAGLRVPLIAAGPAWTRSLVFKAVKYGVDDILVTPSTTGDVREKLQANLIKQAA